MKHCDKMILLIIPWYGQIPGYLDLFCRSVAKSSLVDVLFVSNLNFTDICRKYSNVSVLKLELDELEERIEALCSFRPTLNDNVIKLCDLKPLYGSLFFEQCRNYQYWAFGDCDLIYGDMDAFLRKVKFELYDIVSFRKMWVTGSLTLMKNEDRVTELWRCNPSLKKILTSKEMLCADECGPIWTNLLQGENIMDISLGYIPFTQLVLSHQEIKWYHEDWMCEKLQNGETLKITEKTIFNLQKQQQEFCFHYVIHKHSKLFKFPKDLQLWSMDFYIDETGFYKSLSFHGIRRFWRYTIFYFKRIVNKIKRVIGLG